MGLKRLLRRWKLLRELRSRRIDGGGVGADGNLVAELQRDAGATPALIRCLSHGDKTVRENAIFVLGGVTDERALRGLIGCLKDKVASVRERAAYDLAHFENQAAVRPLVPLLKDESEDVRIAAAGTLSGLADRSALQPLTEALGDPNNLVRMYVVRAIGHIGDATAAGALRHMLADTGPFVPWEALRALADVGAPLAPEEAMKVAMALDEYERGMAIELMGKLKQEGASQALVGEWQNLSWSGRGKAAKALEQLSYEGLADLLLNGLSEARRPGPPINDTALHVRDFDKAAAEILGRLRDPRAVDPLIAAMNDTMLGWNAGEYDGAAVDAAASALVNIGAPAFAPLVKVLVTSPPWLEGASWTAHYRAYRVRRAAAKGLARLGDRRAVPHLRQAMGDPNMKPYVEDALRQLGETV